MSTIGQGYGSEFHLRSALAGNNPRFHKAVVNAVSETGGQIKWLENYLKLGEPELRGVDFLPDAGGKPWKQYWPDPKAGCDPNRRGIHNWDAVGCLLKPTTQSEWLLVEAKAHAGEFTDSPACGAGTKSRETIHRAFQKTRHAMGLAESESPVPLSWFYKGGYQIANRLASLNYLLNEAKPHIPAHLLFIYYINDTNPNGCCPRSKNEWQVLLKRKYEELGIPDDHKLKPNVHYLFYDCTSPA